MAERDPEERLRDIEYMIARLCSAVDYANICTALAHGGSSVSCYGDEWWGIRTGHLKRGE